MTALNNDTPADAKKARGAEIERRLARGPHGRRIEVARRAGLSRQTVDNAINGVAAPKTYDKIEAALDAIEHPADVPDQPGAVAHGDEGLVEFEVNVDAIGVRVVVRGPVANAADLERQAAAIIRDIRRDDAGDFGDTPK